jgi:hypothetical protein
MKSIPSFTERKMSEMASYDQSSPFPNPWKISTSPWKFSVLNLHPSKNMEIPHSFGSPILHVCETTESLAGLSLPFTMASPPPLPWWIWREMELRKSEGCAERTHHGKWASLSSLPASWREVHGALIAATPALPSSQALAWTGAA